VPVSEICRKAGISQASYFNWKKKYDGLMPSEMRRLKELEEENTNAPPRIPTQLAKGASSFSTAIADTFVGLRIVVKVKPESFQLTKPEMNSRQS
jgi:hypothetical protein